MNSVAKTPEAYNVDNPLQAKRSSGQKDTTGTHNSKGVELLRSSGTIRIPYPELRLWLARGYPRSRPPVLFDARYW